ncbi:MAG: putative immunity protein [Patescibacteria group bacterium]
MKKYSKTDQKILAAWAIKCAEKVLPFFEKAYPQDNRPRQALEVGKKWIKTGIFKMLDIRSASLEAHAAAREAKDNEAACLAARAAGQAVATAHVTQHAYGGAYYALKALIADNQNEKEVTKAYNWQKKHLPENLRQEIMSRIVIAKNKRGLSIKINKDQNF